MWRAYTHEADHVRLLLKFGVNPNVRDQQGRTALDLASLELVDSQEVVELLKLVTNVLDEQVEMDTGIGDDNSNSGISMSASGND